jgi:hypothetical protein
MEHIFGSRVVLQPPIATSTIANIEPIANGVHGLQAMQFSGTYRLPKTEKCLPLTSFYFTNTIEFFHQTERVILGTSKEDTLTKAPCRVHGRLESQDL